MAYERSPIAPVNPVNLGPDAMVNIKLENNNPNYYDTSEVTGVTSSPKVYAQEYGADTVGAIATKSDNSPVNSNTSLGSIDNDKNAGFLENGITAKSKLSNHYEHNFDPSSMTYLTKTSFNTSGLNPYQNNFSEIITKYHPSGQVDVSHTISIA